MEENCNDRSPLNPEKEESPEYNSILAAKSLAQPTFAKDTVVGELRNPRRFSWQQWIFLIVATLSSLGVLALSIERFVTFERTFYNLSDSNYTTDPLICNAWFCTTDFLFTIVVLVNLAFCLFYCYSGLFRERQFELLAFIVATVVIIIYIIGNYIFEFVTHRHGVSIKLMKTVRLVLVCILGPINIFLAFLSWWKIGYLELNLIGTNKKLLNAYRLRSFVITLQYFHIQIMVNVIVLAFAMNGALIPLAEKVIMFFILIFLLAVSFLGFMAMKWENKVGTIVWQVLMPSFMSYYIYRLVAVAVNWPDYTAQFLETYEDGTYLFSSLKYVASSLIIATSLGIIAVILLIVCMVFVRCNYNLGLKEKIEPPFKLCVQALSRKG